MTQPIFDVAVVGAGPAGSTAAARLAQAGLHVLLLDKAKSFPREKPCGGGITARALTRLPFTRELFAQLPTHTISTMVVEGPTGASFEYTDPNGDPVLFLVRRIEWDAALFRRATTLGATPALGHTVTGLVTDSDASTLTTSTGEQFRARVVIAADSANSVLARLAGLRTGDAHSHFAIDMMEETPYTDLDTPQRDRVTLLLSLDNSYGYGYIFPKQTHLNLGFGSAHDYYAEHVRGRAKEHHADFVDRMKSRGFVTGTTQPSNYRAFPIPISGPLDKTYADRLLLAGDAAGLVNAFSAEGIFFAMRSGDLAAEAILSVIGDAQTRNATPGVPSTSATTRLQPDAQATPPGIPSTGDAAAHADFSARSLRRYQDAWEAELGGELRHSVRIQQRLFSEPGRIDSLIRRSAEDPELKRLLCGYAMGFATYEQLRSHMARVVMPQWVWSKLKSKARTLVGTA